MEAHARSAGVEMILRMPFTLVFAVRLQLLATYESAQAESYLASVAANAEVAKATFELAQKDHSERCSDAGAASNTDADCAGLSAALDQTKAEFGAATTIHEITQKHFSGAAGGAGVSVTELREQILRRAYDDVCKEKPTDAQCVVMNGELVAASEEHASHKKNLDDAANQEEAPQNPSGAAFVGAGSFLLTAALALGLAAL